MKVGDEGEEEREERERAKRGEGEWEKRQEEEVDTIAHECQCTQRHTIIFCTYHQSVGNNSDYDSDSHVNVGKFIEIRCFSWLQHIQIPPRKCNG